MHFVHFLASLHLLVYIGSFSLIALAQVTVNDSLVEDSQADHDSTDTSSSQFSFHGPQLIRKEVTICMETDVDGSHVTHGRSKTSLFNRSSKPMKQMFTFVPESETWVTVEGVKAMWSAANAEQVFQSEMPTSNDTLLQQIWQEMRYSIRWAQWYSVSHHFHETSVISLHHSRINDDVYTSFTDPYLHQERKANETLIVELNNCSALDVMFASINTTLYRTVIESSVRIRVNDDSKADLFKAILDTDPELRINVVENTIVIRAARISLRIILVSHTVLQLSPYQLDSCPLVLPQSFNSILASPEESVCKP